MAHRVVKCACLVLLTVLPQTLWAQPQTYAQQLSLLIPADPEANLISVTVAAGLTSNAGLSAELRQARLDMFADLDVAPATLRALADRRDGLAAQKYVRLLLTDPTATPSDIAHYATVAVSSGRVWTLPDAVAAMLLLDPATEPADRKRAYIDMLYAHAWAGNPLALDAVIDLNGEGRLFGPLSAETLARILEQDAVNGQGRAALRLALHLLAQQARTPEDEARVDDYLTRAAAADNFAVRVTATNMQAQRQNPPEITVVSQ